MESQFQTNNFSRVVMGSPVAMGLPFQTNCCNSIPAEPKLPTHVLVSSIFIVLGLFIAVPVLAAIVAYLLRCSSCNEQVDEENPPPYQDQPRKATVSQRYDPGLANIIMWQAAT
ncbi:hypothetical protein B7494_g6420 [Chlorociboria aeruginascens]|nr:hypothetical protein B7494_g6420 [Chlorociboria aeruginascens]